MRGPSFPTLPRRFKRSRGSGVRTTSESPDPLTSGSALIFALVILVVLSSLMISFLFRIHIEADLAASHRQRMKARALANAGQEKAKVMILQSLNVGNSPDEDMTEETFIQLRNLRRGMAVSGVTYELGDGTFTLHILPETGRRNVNQLSEPDWEALLEQTGVPEELHDELIANFLDWTDEDQANRLKGAEEDDPFYEDNGIPVKNAPLDTLEELLLIKGFTRAIVYGGSLREEYDMPDVQVQGIAHLLSVYGNGKVNLNAASKEVLMTISGLREEQVDSLLENRAGLDGIEGTEDDGFTRLNSALSSAGIPNDASEVLGIADRSHIRVLSIGDVGGTRAATWVVYEFLQRNLTVLAHREEEIP